MAETIDVGKTFYHRLAHRNSAQGDGKHTAQEFREHFLNELDNAEFWKRPKETIILDFRNVRKIGPSFANEAFAYFTQYAKPSEILEAIRILNATVVQMAIIEEELELGYRGR